MHATCLITGWLLLWHVLGESQLGSQVGLNLVELGCHLLPYTVGLHGSCILLQLALEFK